MITGDVPLMNLDGWTWEENMVRPMPAWRLPSPVAEAEDAEVAAEADEAAARRQAVPDSPSSTSC